MALYTVGQRVAYTNSNHHHAWNIYFSNVAKVTATQITLDNGYRYGIKNGRELKTTQRQFPCGQLLNLEAAENIKARFAKRQKDSTLQDDAIAAIKKVNPEYREFTPEQVTALRAVIALFNPKKEAPLVIYDGLFDQLTVEKIKAEHTGD